MKITKKMFDRFRGYSKGYCKILRVNVNAQCSLKDIFPEFRNDFLKLTGNQQSLLVCYGVSALNFPTDSV